MKIAILGSWAESLVNFRGPLIRDLIAEGHEVIAAAPDISTDIRVRVEQLGALVAEIPMARTGMNPISDYRYYRQLRKCLQINQPDIVLSYTIKPNVWGAFAAHREGIPVIAMVTGLGYAFTDTSGFRQRVIRSIATLLYRFATNRNRLVIFQNKDDRADFIAAGCLRDGTKARLVNGSGVDMNHFKRVDLPIEPVFLMISRLLKNKGVREYCNAAVAVKHQNPDVEFLLVGYLDEGPDSVSQTELDTWIAGGVNYLGELKDVRPVIARASVYVLPSYREGTPRSVLEAMAMGRAIITSDAPGCRETVKPAENGYLVSVGNTEAVAQCMRKMINNPQLRSIMGEQSYAYAIEKYDVNKVNRSLMKLLGL